MYTKTIVMTKRSCRGKEFTCIRKMTVMDDYDREERKRKRYAEIKAYHDHLRAIEMQKYEDALHPTSMRRIMDAYEEYKTSDRYY